MNLIDLIREVRSLLAHHWQSAGEALRATGCGTCARIFAPMLFEWRAELAPVLGDDAS